MQITHSVVSAAPNDPTKEVSSTAWNAEHVVTGVVAADISDASTVGKSVLTAADAAAVRTAIGAGTSNFSGVYSALTGAANRTVPLFLPEISDPLTEDEAIAFCRIIAKLTKQGRTGQQAKTRLQSGVAVAI